MVPWLAAKHDFVLLSCTQPPKYRKHYAITHWITQLHIGLRNYTLDYDACLVYGP